jgi:hypothetical protein
MRSIGVLTMSNDKPLWTCRYQEYSPPHYHWWLNVYTPDAPFADTPMTGASEASQPDWLRDIIRAATVGSHMHSNAASNIRFVWFRIDETGALHDFVSPSELGEH